MLSAQTPIFRSLSPTGSTGPGIGAGSFITSGGRVAGAFDGGPTVADGRRAQPVSAAPSSASAAATTTPVARETNHGLVIRDRATLACAVDNVIAAAPDCAMTIGFRPARWATSLLICCLTSASCAARSPAASPAIAGTIKSPAMHKDERLPQIQARLDKLARAAFQFWRVHGPDREQGGFHGTLDRHGNPIDPTDKSLIQTVRHLWAMSMWYERRQPEPEVKALADGLYAFLMAHFRDPA